MLYFNPAENRFESSEMAMHQTVVETPEYVGTFDELIQMATANDVLRARHVTTHFHFTEGKDYPVHTGNQLFTSGRLTIADDNDMEVPTLTSLPQRKNLPDTFELIKGKSAVEKMLEELSTKLDDMKADAEQLRKDIATLDEFDPEWNTNYRDLSREDKAALHLALHEGKALQYAWDFYSKWEDVPHIPNWNMNGRVFYRVKPLSYTILKDILSDVEREISELEESMESLKDS